MPYQPLPILFLAAVMGITANRFFSVSYSVWCCGFFAALAAWGIARRSGKQNLAAFLVSFAGFCLFGLLHHQHWDRFAPNDLGRFAVPAGEPAAIQGIVTDMPRYTDAPPPESGRVFQTTDRTQFTLLAKKMRDGTEWLPVTGRVAVSVPGDLRKFRIGDSLLLFGELSKPLGSRNPGDFDYADYLRSRRILCLLRCSSGEAISVQQTGPLGFSRMVETIRRAGLKRLEQHMTPETAPLAAAMLLGVREGIDEETTQSLLETGTMHILAISGLHIGLMAATVGLLLSFCGVSRRKTAIMLVLTVLLYLCLTDVRPPAIRATVLVCTLSVALYSGRRALGVNTLCATALVVLAINPTELFQFGAQLSFIATGAFLWVPNVKQLRMIVFREQKNDENKENEVERYEYRRFGAVVLFRRLVIGSLELLLISLTLWCTTMPLILDRIHLFTPIAVAVNPLLWLPLTASLLSGFAVLILGGIPLVGDFCGIMAHYAFSALFGMIAGFQALSQEIGGHCWSPGPPAWWLIGFYGVFAFFTFLPVRRPKKILACLCLFWFAVGFCCGYVRDFVRQYTDTLTVAVFSVGHGSCVLMVTPQGKTIVFDVGSMASSKRAADVLSHGLWRLGKTRIDALILSHSDNDHINGVMPLADRFKIEAVYVSPYMFDSIKYLEQKLEGEPEIRNFERTLYDLRAKMVEKKVPMIVFADGDSMPELKNSQILHPPRENFGDSHVSNATSLVLRFEHHGVGVLLPGDLEGRLTPPFLERQPMPTDIVMLPHHGGQSNQTEPSLSWTQPKLLLISAGRFTHRDATLDGFRARGVEVCSTFEKGMIEINIDKGGIHTKN